MAKKAKKRSGRPTVYGLANDQCVWSRAGVIKPVKCINAFDCLGCTFDQKVQSNFVAKQEKAGDTWSTKNNARIRLTAHQLKCRHMLSGRVDHKLCAHSYNCAKCPYDQMIEDTGYAPGLQPPACDQASGFNVARDHYYHYGHAWARVEYGGKVRIGVDDFALRLLGPQDEIKLPKLGATVGQGSPQAILTRGTNEAAAMSPVEGKVVAVNYKVTREARLANKAPYADGWLMVIQPTGLKKNLKNLFFGTECMAWMDDEATRLNSLLSEETGYQMAATGGEAIGDIYGAVPEIGWDRLVQEFLG